MNLERGDNQDRDLVPSLIGNVFLQQGICFVCVVLCPIQPGYKMIQSMIGKGNCYDNAMMESFFHTLKTELIYFKKCQTRFEAKGEIFEYIGVFYNRIRGIHRWGISRPWHLNSSICLNGESVLLGEDH